MNYRPLFIFGLARSGTNLLARMLNCNPWVAVALDPLLPLFRSLRNAIVARHAPDEVRQSFAPSAPFQDFYFHPDGPKILDLILSANADIALGCEELTELKSRITERAALMSPKLACHLRDLEGDNYARLISSGLGIVSQLSPQAVWVGCKEVWVADFLPLLARTFPEARFYFIERDPRAIVSSLIAMASKDPSQAAHVPSYLRHWRKNIALARRFQSDPVLSKRFRLISYERLVVEPKTEALRICGELGIDFTPTMLQLSADGWCGNSSYDQAKRDVYQNSVNRWVEYLPDRVLQTADFLCSPEMRLTAYRPITEPKTTEVLSFFIEANQNPGSWRSDSADPLFDFGSELIRHTLLESKDIADERLVRRCFLFNDTLNQIRSTGR